MLVYFSGGDTATVYPNNAICHGASARCAYDESGHAACATHVLQELQDLFALFCSPARLWVRRIKEVWDFFANARAIATRCCSPPDSCVGKLLRRFSSPTRVSVSVASSESGQI